MCVQADVPGGGPCDLRPLVPHPKVSKVTFRVVAATTRTITTTTTTKTTKTTTKTT